MGDISLSAWYDMIESKRKRREYFEKSEKLKKKVYVPEPDSRVYLRSSLKKRKYWNSVRMSEDLSRWMK